LSNEVFEYRTFKEVCCIKNLAHCKWYIELDTLRSPYVQTEHRSTFHLSIPPKNCEVGKFSGYQLSILAVYIWPVWLFFWNEFSSLWPDETTAQTNFPSQFIMSGNTCYKVTPTANANWSHKQLNEKWFSLASKALQFTRAICHITSSLLF
jgi:hypothetical protein